MLENTIGHDMVDVSTHSRAKAAENGEPLGDGWVRNVSTHSRAKAAERGRHAAGGGY